MLNHRTVDGKSNVVCIACRCLLSLLRKQFYFPNQELRLSHSFLINCSVDHKVSIKLKGKFYYSFHPFISKVLNKYAVRWWNIYKG